MDQYSGYRNDKQPQLATLQKGKYATDECSKFILHLHHLLEDLGLLADDFMPNPTTIYNNNVVCMAWSHALTKEGLRHVQIRKNAIREVIPSLIF